jgi:hypothetical protein
LYDEQPGKWYVFKVTVIFCVLPGHRYDSLADVDFYNISYQIITSYIGKRLIERDTMLEI